MVKVTGCRAAAAMALLSAAVALPACGINGAPSPASSARAGTRAERIVPAPKRVLAVTEPQPNGTVWALAGGKSSRGLFEFDLPSGHVVGSVSVSKAAQAVAQSQTGMIGLALATKRTGALQLLNGSTAKVIRVVPLAAPARDVVIGSDGVTFYVLTGGAKNSSVTVVDSRDGRVLGKIPVPGNTVSIAADAQQTTLYVLQRNGHVSEVSIADGRVTSSFVVGDTGRSLALSPDGSTLYVLKDTTTTVNVAVVNVATESVRRALPAPSHCLEVLTSANGSQLYEVVGAAGFGNIQIFAI
jgi:DNA-binding beta-propeller fold protein YncE